MKLLFAALALTSALTASAAPLRQDLKNVCVLVKAEAIDRSSRPAGTATGTGFLIGPDLVLTCNHLTFIPTPHGQLNADRMMVELKRGQFVKARVVRRDREHDLAVLRIETKSEISPYAIADYDLKSGDDVTIVGNFPEAIRITRGELMSSRIMRGFAMSSAKVRSGFSGGPVLDKDGRVQGILSQRDDDNNSIFVRSDVIKKLLKGLELPGELNPMASSTIDLADARERVSNDTPAEATGPSKSTTLTAATTSRQNASAVSANSAVSVLADKLKSESPETVLAEEIIIALPMRPGQE